MLFYPLCKGAQSILFLNRCAIILVYCSFAICSYVVNELRVWGFLLLKASIILNVLLLSVGILWGIICIIDLGNSQGMHGLGPLIGLLFCPIIFAISTVWSLINSFLWKKDMEKNWQKISTFTRYLSVILIVLFFIGGK